MNEADQLTPLLDAAGITAPDIGASEVAALCELIGLDADDPLTDEIADEIARIGSAHWTDGDRPPGTYAFRIGKWRVSLGSDAGVKTGILTAIVAGALISQGVHEVGVAVATAVLPTVVDVTSIELGAGDRKMVIELRLKESVRDGFMTEDELYASLPDEHRRTVSPYDFADFVERLRQAALVTEENGWLQPLDPDRRRPFISWS